MVYLQSFYAMHSTDIGFTGGTKPADFPQINDNTFFAFMQVPIAFFEALCYNVIRKLYIAT